MEHGGAHWVCGAGIQHKQALTTFPHHHSASKHAQKSDPFLRQGEHWGLEKAQWRRLLRKGLRGLYLSILQKSPLPSNRPCARSGVTLPLRMYNLMRTGEICLKTNSDNKNSLSLFLSLSILKKEYYGNVWSPIKFPPSIYHREQRLTRHMCFTILKEITHYW